MDLLPYSNNNKYSDRTMSTTRPSRHRSRDKFSIFSQDDSCKGDDDSFFSNGIGNLSRNMMGQMDRMMAGMLGGAPGGGNSFPNDPFFGGSPFGAMMAPPQMAMPMNRGNNQLALMNRGNNQLALSPFDPMGQMMSSMNMSREGSCQTYSSSSVMTMSTGPDGRPQMKALGATKSNGCHWRESASKGLQVYQATSSSRGVPGGVCETKKTVSDSTSGVRKMAIGRHINDRSHVVEKEMRAGGDLEERQEFINLDEEEAPEFDNEFQRITQQGYGQGAHDSRHRQITAASPPNQRSTYMPIMPSPTNRADSRQKYRDRKMHRRNNF